MKRYTDDEVRAALIEAIKEAGSAKKFATRINIQPSFISGVLREQKPPGSRIAEALGFVLDPKRWVRVDKNKE